MAVQICIQSGIECINMYTLVVVTNALVSTNLQLYIFSFSLVQVCIFQQHIAMGSTNLYTCVMYLTQNNTPHSTLVASSTDNVNVTFNQCMVDLSL